MQKPHSIGELHETSLHASIKHYLAMAGDDFEAQCDGYIIDIVREDRLIEIQTGGFHRIRRKLERLLENNRLTLVYPLTIQKWIIRLDQDGQQVSRRKSPRHGQLVDVFYELVRIPGILLNDNLTLLVLQIDEEEILQRGERGSWRRRGWEVADRRLLGVIGEVNFQKASDYLHILPSDLPDRFTNKELASSLGCRPNLAGKITYTLRQMGVLEMNGKKGNANLFSQTGALT